MRTKIIVARSISDLGLSAEMIPIGRAISIQRIAPPKTSAAVTGTASPIISFTVRRLTYERPSDWSTTSRFRKQPVLLVDGPVEAELVLDPRHVLGRRRLPGREPRRVGREEEEEDVRDQRHADEQHDCPEESSYEVLEHGWRVER